MFGISAFLVLPILVVAGLILQRWDLIGPRTFVGFENFVPVAVEQVLDADAGPRGQPLAAEHKDFLLKIARENAAADLPCPPRRCRRRTAPRLAPAG